MTLETPKPIPKSQSEIDEERRIAELDRVRLRAWNNECGRSAEENINLHIEYYATFLHDDDFEYWQPCCYMKKNTIEWWDYYLEAQREYIRALWIMNRFDEFYSAQWSISASKFDDAWKIYGIQSKMVESMKSNKNKLPSPEKYEEWF